MKEILEMKRTHDRLYKKRLARIQEEALLKEAQAKAIVEK